MSFEGETTGMEDAYVSDWFFWKLEFLFESHWLFLFYHIFFLQSTLPELNDVPRQQGAAAGASTTVDYQSELHIMSRAARVLLSGIVCTIGNLMYTFLYFVYVLPGLFFQIYEKFVRT